MEFYKFILNTDNQITQTESETSLDPVNIIEAGRATQHESFPSGMDGVLTYADPGDWVVKYDETDSYAILPDEIFTKFYLPFDENALMYLIAASSEDVITLDEQDMGETIDLLHEVQPETNNLSHMIIQVRSPEAGEAIIAEDIVVYDEQEIDELNHAFDADDGTHNEEENIDLTSGETVTLPPTQLTTLVLTPSITATVTVGPKDALIITKDFGQQFGQQVDRALEGFIGAEPEVTSDEVEEEPDTDEASVPEFMELPLAHDISTFEDETSLRYNQYNLKHFLTLSASTLSSGSIVVYWKMKKVMVGGFIERCINAWKLLKNGYVETEAMILSPTQVGQIQGFIERLQEHCPDYSCIPDMEICQHRYDIEVHLREALDRTSHVYKQRIDSLSKRILDLVVEIDEKDEEISDLEDTVEELEGKISDIEDIID